MPSIPPAASQGQLWHRAPAPREDPCKDPPLQTFSHPTEAHPLPREGPCLTLAALSQPAWPLFSPAFPSESPSSASGFCHEECWLQDIAEQTARRERGSISPWEQTEPQPCRGHSGPSLAPAPAQCQLQRDNDPMTSPMACPRCIPLPSPVPGLPGPSVPTGICPCPLCPQGSVPALLLSPRTFPWSLPAPEPCRTRGSQISSRQG